MTSMKIVSMIAAVTFMIPAVSRSNEIAKKVYQDAYPGDIALSVDVNGVSEFRAVSNMHPIYVYDGDFPAQSNCNEGCIGPWSPVLATYQSTKAVGYWTQIIRSEGRIQWAYKGHPIYTFYNDSTDKANGDNADGGKWHVFSSTILPTH